MIRTTATVTFTATLTLNETEVRAFGNFSETVGRDVIWRCSFRAGKPWCKVKGTK